MDLVVTPEVKLLMAESIIMVEKPIITWIQTAFMDLEAIPATTFTTGAFMALTPYFPGYKSKTERLIPDP
jgi:hypothetical protein